jgi:2-polyprenyl-3-methyl-5-hydroxy-6-metoxy-1,4-benzoquinol methylase
MTSYSDHSCYIDIAAAYVRGTALTNTSEQLKNILDPILLQKPFGLLTEAEKITILDTGKRVGLKLDRFKRSYESLPRVRRVLGFLHGMMPKSLLDAGSGRGVFLWSCLNEFPDLKITANDKDIHRIQLYETVRHSGIERLNFWHGEFQNFSKQDKIPHKKQFDTVTLLEVLEHVPCPLNVIATALETARRCIVISVPAKEDGNPEHIHLLTKSKLETIFHNAGLYDNKHYKIQFDGVSGHLLVFITLNTSNVF